MGHIYEGISNYQKAFDSYLLAKDVLGLDHPEYERLIPILQARDNCGNMRSDKKRTTQVPVLLDFFVDNLHIYVKFLCQT